MQGIMDMSILNDHTLTKGLTLNLSNDLKQNITEEVAKGQETFIDTSLGKAINFGLDIGLKSILPDVVEDLVIDIKDTILREGFGEGLKTLVKSFMDIGKSVSGIVTGNFENLNQIDIATKNGGVINTVSKLLNLGIDKAIDKNLLDPGIGSIIRSGKTAVLSSFSNKLEDTIKSQFRTFEKLEDQISKWENNLANKDLDKMNRNIVNINKYYNSLVPFENTLIKTREVNVLHNWIKENKSFDIPEEMYSLLEQI